MQAKYTLSNGEVISLYLWSDFVSNQTWREFAEVRRLNADGTWSEREVERKVELDQERGVYIVWNDEKVFLNEFDYMSYETLMEKIREGKEKNDRWLVRDDDILATFLRESEKVSVWAELPVYAMRTPFGFSLCGDEQMGVLCKLVEDRYKKDSWHYKVTLQPITEELRELCATRDFYFSDFCSLLKADVFALVDNNMELA